MCSQRENSMGSKLISSPEKKRLDAAFALKPVDRPPSLAGWISDPVKIFELTGCTEDEYWDDPEPLSIEAYKRLGVDGLLDVNVPVERGGYRIISHKDLEERAKYASGSPATLQ